MTGNVNIYICSEANENPKDKQKQKDQCVEDSETASETKTCTSDLSVSTSKLVAALQKKQRENSNKQTLSCLCVPSESSIKETSIESKLADDDGNNVFRVCDEENVDAEFQDTPSFSSRDACICDDPKFSNFDVPSGSDMERSSDLGSFVRMHSSQEYMRFSDSESDRDSYDKNDFWPFGNRESSCYEKNWTSRSQKGQGNVDTKYINEVRSTSFIFFLNIQCNNSDFSYLIVGSWKSNDLDDNCSCCNLKRCRERPKTIASPCVRDQKSSQSEPEKLSERTSKLPRNYKKCPCIIEEENEDCCNDQKAPEQKQIVTGQSSTNGDEAKQEENIASKSNSSTLQRGKDSESKFPNDHILSIHEKQDEPNVGVSDDTKPESLKDQEPNVSVSEHKKPGPPKTPEPNVGVSEDIKPEPPKAGLLWNFRNSFKRLSSNDESKTGTAETKKQQVNETSGKRKEDENILRVYEDKQKSSFWNRSIKKAINIVTTGNDEDESTPQVIPKSSKSSPKRIPNQPKLIPIPKPNATNESLSFNPTYKEIDNESPAHISSASVKPETRTRSRIGSAISSRRSSAATSNNVSNPSICNELCPAAEITSPDPTRKDSQLKSQTCECGKPPETCECLKIQTDHCKCHPKCKTIKRPKQEFRRSECTNPIKKCTCCNRKMEPESVHCTCYPTCENPIQNFTCCNRKPKPKIDLCKCCPECGKSATECKCSDEQETRVEESCKCCRQPKRFPCCKIPTSAKRRQPSGFFSSRQCSTCCSPITKCSFNEGFANFDELYLKSMICIYCDNPRENCICTAPIHKCSQCGLPLDVCGCKIVPCYECGGRQIAPAERSNEQTISVTAWKPRQNVRRYFARKPDDGNSEEDWDRYEKFKPYGSERLAYQEGRGFSNVMSELQQKISDLVSCNVCRNVPCCCTEVDTTMEDIDETSSRYEGFF